MASSAATMSGSASLTLRPAKSVTRSSNVPSSVTVLQRDPVLLAEPEVVLAEGDGGVDEPRAVLGGDEVPSRTVWPRGP